MHSPATDSAGDGSCQPGQVILSDAEVSEAVHLFGLAPMHVPASGDPEHTDVNFQASALSRLPDPEVATPAWQSGIVTTASTSSERSVAYQSAAGAATRQPAATSARHREDLKAMKNREAQKRFKQKQKVALAGYCKDLISWQLPVFLTSILNKLNSLYAKQARSNEIEAQLAETTQRLKQLQEQKEQLEARNALLEKVSHFSMTQTSRPFTDVTDQVFQPSCVLCGPCESFARCSVPLNATQYQPDLEVLHSMLRYGIISNCNRTLCSSHSSWCSELACTLHLGWDCHAGI